MSTLSTLKYITLLILAKTSLVFTLVTLDDSFRKARHSYIFPINPYKSLVFQYLTCCRVTCKVVTFTSKQSQIMGLHTILMGIIPDRLYTVNEAARFLCVHRCTIYAYINHQEKPLPFVMQQGNMRILFQGCDLTAYKASGLPKKGRKRKSDMQ